MLTLWDWETGTVRWREEQERARFFLCSRSRAPARSTSPPPATSPSSLTPASQTLLEEPVGAAADRAACDALLARSAEAAAGEAGGVAYPPRGRAAAAARAAALAAAARASAAAPGAVRGLAFVDAEALAWSLADQAGRGAARTAPRGSVPAAGGGAAATAPPPLDAAAAAAALGGGASAPAAGPRWLVAACDTKVLARDLSGEDGGRGWEVPRSALDARAPTCLALLARFVVPPPPQGGSGGGGGGGGGAGPSAPPVAPGGAPAPPRHTSPLPLSPALAVGTASGAVFLLAPDTGAVLARLGGGHKAAVTAALALHAPDGGAGCALITAAADGSVAFWAPSDAAAAAASLLAGAAAGASGAEAPAPASALLAGGAGGLPELPPAGVVAAHVGGVVGAALTSVPDPPPKGAPVGPAGSAAPPPRPSAPPAPALRLATVGADGTVALWDLGGGGRQLARARPLPRPPPGAGGTGPAGGLAPGGLATVRGGNAPGGADALLLISGDAPGVWAWPARAWEAAGAAASALAFPMAAGGRPPDLRAALPSGSKRLPKLYTVAAHPLRGDVVAVGGNAGVLLLRGGEVWAGAPPTSVVAAAPPPSPALARVPPGRGRGGCAFLAASRGRLWGVEYRAGWREEGAVGGGGPGGGGTARATGGRPASLMTADLASRGIVGDLPDHPGPCRVLASACGGWVAVLWPAAARFAAFERPPEEAGGSGVGGRGQPPPAAAPPLGSRPWIPAASGTALDLAWASTSPRLAVLTPSAVAGGGAEAAAAAAQQGRRRSSRGGGGATSAASASALPASVDLVDFAPSSPVNESVGGASLVATGVGPPGPPALRLHGGAMLGVVCAGGGLHLLPWADPAGPPGGRPSPPPLCPGLAPAWVGWAPGGAGLALALPDGVELLARREEEERAGRGGGATAAPSTLTPFARPAIPGVTAGAWEAQHLTLLSPASVHVLFIAGLGGGAATPRVEVLTVAALSPGPAAFPPPPAGGAYLPFPPPASRPPGALALAGAADGALWVVDTALRPTPLPLASHAGARARGLAAAGDTAGAAAVAGRGLARHAHGDAAAFFAAAAGPSGAAAGADLPGVPPRGRAALARAAGRLAAAVRSLEEAAGGWGGGGQAPPPPALAFGVEGLAAPPALAPAAAAAAPAFSTDSGGDSAPLPPAIPWDGPLLAAAKGAGAASPSPSSPLAGASPAAAAAIVADALALAGAAWSAGEAEATGRALGVALAAAPALPQGPLSAVLVRAARAGRGGAAGAAVAALAALRSGGGGGPGWAGPPPGVAALAAALAAGGRSGGSGGGSLPPPPAASTPAAALASAGLVAEAALWATTWREGGARAAVAAWADALAAQNGGGSARVERVAAA